MRLNYIYLNGTDTLLANALHIIKTNITLPRYIEGNFTILKLNTIYCAVNLYGGYFSFTTY